MNDHRFLADEGCDHRIVLALRAAGYDVFAVVEQLRSEHDLDLIALAHQQKRVLITEDKDFGWLVFVAQASSSGVILTRYPGHMHGGLAAAVLNLVQEHGSQLADAFVVMQPGHVRFSRRPGVR